MKPTNEPYDDPLIDEVRERRRALLADYDNDLNTLIDALEDAQAEHPERLCDDRKSGSNAGRITNT